MKETKMKNVSWLLVVVCVLSLAVLGCNEMLDRLTPATIAEISADYSDIEVPVILEDIGSLRDARKVRDAIIIKHRTEQLDLMRLAQDDEFAYADAIGFMKTSIAAAERLQDLIVGSEGEPFSILGILAGVTGGAAIGKALKRKGDYSPAEVAEKVAEAKNGTSV